MSTGSRWTAIPRNAGARMAAAAALAALFLSDVALAQSVPFEDAVTLSTVVDPLEWDFDIPQSGGGHYRLTMTDLGALLTVPAAAPLVSVQAVITHGQTVVATLDGDKDDTSPVDTVDFDAAPGTYRVHVVGTPGTGIGSGPVGIKITTTDAAPTTIRELTGTLSPPATTRTDLRTYQLDLDVPADGDYELTLADLQFPHANMIDTASVFLFQAGSSSLAACLNVPALPPACPDTRTVTLTAGHYQLVAGGALATGKDAGVFSVYMKSVATGAVLHRRTVELGTAKRVSDSSFVLNAGQYTLSTRDLAFPAALTESAALVTAAAQVVAQANLATPDQPFTVPADRTAYEVFSYAKADATAAAGSYDVLLRPASGPAALDFVGAIGDASGSPSAYTFPIEIPSAGTYDTEFADFQFPAALGASRVAVVQGGSIVSKTDPGAAATLSLNSALAAGDATVIVIVKPARTTGGLAQVGGIFGIETSLAGVRQNLLEVTQGVGGLVSVEKVSVLQSGHYDLTVADLAAPEVFNDLMVVISRGTEKIGTAIVGSGGANPQGASATLADLDLTAANYSITLIATPGTALHASTYGLAMKASPPAPTVTLSANPMSVESGKAVGLVWSSQGAVSCTASSNPGGAWSGTKAVSGSDSSAVISAATTFTLKCMDANNRSGEKSVTVDIAAPSTPGTGGGGGGGGGGAFDWLTIGALAAGWFARSRSRRIAAAA